MSGFLSGVTERAALIVRVLHEIAAEPELRARVAVGGGAALHLARPDPWRLTADLDLHHLCDAEGEVLLRDAAHTERLLEVVVDRCGLPSPLRFRNETGVRWLLYGAGGAAGADPVRLDLTFLTPTPVWAPETMRPHLPGGSPGPEIHRMAADELVGNKLGTLFVRRRSRDLYDAHGLLTGRAPPPDRARVRVVFVLALAVRPNDPRRFGPGGVGCSAEELRQNLLPYLGMAERERALDPDWAERLLRETRDALGIVVPLEPHEHEFVARLRDHGEVRPELLTGDAALAERIRRNGILLRDGSHSPSDPGQTVHAEPQRGPVAEPTGGPVGSVGRDGLHHLAA